MNLKIYGEEETKKLDWCFRLVKEGEKVKVIAADKNTGERVCGGTLLIFMENGSVTMCDNINPDLGFDMDSEGHIISNED